LKKAISGSTDYDEQFDAFDQPNVQESKDNTGRLLNDFERSGKLPVEAPAVEHGIGVGLLFRWYEEQNHQLGIRRYTQGLPQNGESWRLLCDYGIARGDSRRSCW
jgi:hypothetical protein